jgi:hypothetical protein
MSFNNIKQQLKKGHQPMQVGMHRLLPYAHVLAQPHAPRRSAENLANCSPPMSAAGYAVCHARCKICISFNAACPQIRSIGGCSTRQLLCQGTQPQTTNSCYVLTAMQRCQHTAPHLVTSNSNHNQCDML